MKCFEFRNYCIFDACFDFSFCKSLKMKHDDKDQLCWLYWFRQLLKIRYSNFQMTLYVWKYEEIWVFDRLRILNKSYKFFDEWLFDEEWIWMTSWRRMMMTKMKHVIKSAFSLITEFATLFWMLLNWIILKFYFRWQII